MARINGKAVRLTLGSPAKDMWLDLTNARIESEEIDSPTFNDIETGAAQFFLRGTAKQDTATGSLWEYVWTNSGKTDVPFVFGPHGTTVGTATKPVVTGALNIGRKPSLGGDANSEATFDIEFEIVGIPAISRTGTP